MGRERELRLKASFLGGERYFFFLGLQPSSQSPLCQSENITNVATICISVE